MKEKITCEQFKEAIKKYGYSFNEENKYTCADGLIVLTKNEIFCYNKVVYGEFRNYVSLSYPNVDDNLEKICKFYVDDFKYHLSYSAYKDFMNMEDQTYTPIFKSYLHNYYTGGEDVDN